MIRGSIGHRGDVDHPQPRLAEQQEQEEEALLVGLGHAAAAAADRAADRDRRDDHDRLVVEVELHRVPHRLHPVLQPLEPGVASLVVEVGQRRHGRPGIRARASSCAHPRLRLVDAGDVERPDRAAEARRSSSPTGSPTRGPRWPRTPAAPRGSAGAGRRAQARRQVGDAADRGVVEAPLEPDPAERGEALGDADAEAEVVAAPAPARGQLGDPVAHRDRHRHGALGRVVARAAGR